MKKVIVTVVAAVLLMGSTFSVNAAGLRDVFSAKYYADKYPDLKAAFGYDEEMLYKHFLEYGLKEGRNMSPILDVQEYREKYADLDAAFGDNWDAYVEHFFDYGINENRDTGTNFDVKTYIEAYDDIKAAFGNDYSAVVEHFLTFGMEENRNLGDPEVYQAAQAPQVPQMPPQDDEPGAEPDLGDDSDTEDGTDTETGEGSDSADDEDAEERELVSFVTRDDNGNIIEEVFCYYIKEKDAGGRVIRGNYYKTIDYSLYRYELHDYGEIDGGTSWTVTTYDAEDSFLGRNGYEYDTSGKMIKRLWYDENDRLVLFYDMDGEDVVVRSTYIIEDGSKSVTELDLNGEIVKSSFYDSNGQLKQVTEYYLNEEGNKLQKTIRYNSDGSFTEVVCGENGKILSETRYDANGELVSKFEYTYDDAGVKTEQKTLLDCGIIITRKYDSYGNEIEFSQTDTEGNLETIVYRTFGEDGKCSVEKAVNVKTGEYSIQENENGVIVKLSGYSKDNVLLNWTIYEYNESNQQIGYKNYNADGSLNSYGVKEYDAASNLISHKLYGADGTLVSEW